MRKLLDNVSLTLLNTGLVDLDTKWNFDNVISPFSRIYYVTNGKAWVYHNKKTFELKPGYMYLIPSYTYSRYKCENKMSQYYLSVLEDNIDGISIFNQKEFNYEIKADEISLSYFKRILELNPKRTIERNDPKIYDNREGLLTFKKANDFLTEKAYMETRGLLFSILSKFISLEKNTKEKKHSIKSILTIPNYIDEHLKEDLTVEILAKVCNLNIDYFSRLFKDTYHVRPNQYIQNKRIERAQLLLLTTNNSLQEITDKIGISNVAYFSRLFKKISGKSPSQFRRDKV